MRRPGKRPFGRGRAGRHRPGATAAYPPAVANPHRRGDASHFRVYHLKATHDRVVEILVENLKHFYAGEPLRKQVDFSTGYRKLPTA